MLSAGEEKEQGSSRQYAQRNSVEWRLREAGRQQRSAPALQRTPFVNVPSTMSSPCRFHGIK